MSDFSLIPTDTITKEVFLSSDNAVSALVDQVEQSARQELLTVGDDVSTKKNRDLIKKVASCVSKSKVFLDDLGKSAVEDWNRKVKAVNEQRKEVRERLADLREELREPLTVWEESQKRLAAHIEAVETSLCGIRDAVGLVASQGVAALEPYHVQLADAKEEVGELGDDASKIMPDLLAAAESALASARTVAEQADADRAELDRLRKEREEEARAAEEARKQAEAEHAAVLKQQQEQLAAQQRELAEAQARMEREQAEREAEQKREREEAERQAQAERQKLDEERRAFEQQKADAERKEREAQEQAQREREEAERQAQREQEQLELRTNLTERISSFLTDHRQVKPSLASQLTDDILGGFVPHVRAIDNNGNPVVMKAQ